MTRPNCLKVHKVSAY